MNDTHTKAPSLSTAHHLYGEGEAVVIGIKNAAEYERFVLMMLFITPYWDKKTGFHPSIDGFCSLITPYWDKKPNTPR